MKKKIVVVGGGPAGMMASIRVAQLQQDVILIEKNPALGRKLLLSGKGRCNLTNTSELDSFLKRFSKNGAFLRDAFKKFFNRELMDFFDKRGLKLKVERQLRVFPVTDRSDSVLNVLKNELAKQKVKVMTGNEVNDLIMQDKKVKAVILRSGEIINADKVIMATGGASYKFTGSTGEGIELARKLGHRVIPLRPGLVGLEVRQKFAAELEGLTLKNIRLKFSASKKEIVTDVGELLFTGYGISGPLVLSLSSQVIDWLSAKDSVYVEIDLKPGLSKEQLDLRLLREFTTEKKKSIRTVLGKLLPRKMADVFSGLSGIDAKKQVSQITKEERQVLSALLKSLRLNILRARPLEEAMVTKGGVSLKDIDPRSMQSRLIKGLYFCGEMLDVDADTGGYNLQAAFSTGFLAGESAALS